MKISEFCFKFLLIYSNIIVTITRSESVRDEILRELTDPIVLRTIADLLAMKIEQPDRSIPGKSTVELFTLIWSKMSHLKQ